jgi:hypothetical protein
MRHITGDERPEQTFLQYKCSKLHNALRNGKTSLPGIL